MDNEKHKKSENLPNNGIMLKPSEWALPLYAADNDQSSAHNAFTVHLQTTKQNAKLKEGDADESQKPSLPKISATTYRKTNQLTPSLAPVKKQLNYASQTSKQPVALLVCSANGGDTIQIPKCYLVVGDTTEKKASTAVGCDISLNRIDNVSEMSMEKPDSKMDEDQIIKCTQNVANINIGNPAKVRLMPETLVSAIPEGLKCLRHLDRVFIHQKVELLEVFANWEASNRYIIFNTDGNQLFFVSEESDICSRQCCGRERSFTLHFRDKSDEEVAVVRRQFSCGASLAGCHICCCCFCWGPRHRSDRDDFYSSTSANKTTASDWPDDKKRNFNDSCFPFHSFRDKVSGSCIDQFMQAVVLEDPNGVIIGRIQQEPTCTEPVWSVLNNSDTLVLQIIGPRFCCCCCQRSCFIDRKQFRIVSADGTTILGFIQKEWTGLVRELFTDADDFSLSFPQDLDTRVKALLLAAVFLLDFTFFESNRGQAS